MKRNLKTQILLLLVLMLLAQTLVTVVLTLLQKQEMKRDVISRTSATALEQTDRLARSAWLMCRLLHTRIENQMQRLRAGAEADIQAAGGIRLEGEQTIDIVSGRSGEKRTVRVPRLLLGQVPFNFNADPDVPSPLIDALARHSGMEVALWQRLNPAGDMFRLSATWLDATGRRPAGLYQSATDPDWQPISASILAGRAHFSVVAAGNRKFAAYFVPLFAGERKEVVGMLGLGLDMADLVDSLTSSLATLESGNNGYVGILIAGGGSSGTQPSANRGLVVLGQSRQNVYKPGDNLWDANVEGDYPTRQLINAALTGKGDQPVRVRYRWRNSSAEPAKWKNAGAIYFAPFDWCIFAGVYDDAFQDIEQEVDDNLNHMLVASIGGSILVLLLAAGVAWLLLQRLIRPLNRLTDTLGVIATGDLVTARQHLREEDGASGSSEAVMLRDAAGRMTGSLLALVQQAQRSSVQLVSSANQIRATSQTQEATVEDFNGHVTRVAAAIQEISATAQELAHTMSQLKDSATTAATLAAEGKDGIGGMQAMLRGLSDETRSIAGKLALINEKTGNIGAVVTTITKVAEQTNLLSLNAAIEAEKAGESGLGFAVVAREIRHLADQTAVATLDIARMVKEMQASVAAGVMAMDRFAEDVRTSVETGNTVGTRLGEVIGRVQELTPEFQRVNEGMEMQSLGARQISDSMVQLKTSAAHLAASFREFNEAADNLRSAADAMKEEVARFKVS